MSTFLALFLVPGKSFLKKIKIIQKAQKAQKLNEESPGTRNNARKQNSPG
jgi:hypothetical protein